MKHTLSLLTLTLLSQIAMADAPPAPENIVEAVVVTAAPKNDGFDSIYTDKSGLRWGKRLPGLFTNGCVDKSNKWLPAYADGYCSEKIDAYSSQAAAACKSAGARLPTAEEYNSLIQEFDYEMVTNFSGKTYPALTEQGADDMNRLGFGLDGKDVAWWTKSKQDKSYHTNQGPRSVPGCASCSITTDDTDKDGKNIFGDESGNLYGMAFLTGEGQRGPLNGYVYTFIRSYKGRVRCVK